MRLAVLVGADRSVAEELMQDAFVAVHHPRDHVRDPLPYLPCALPDDDTAWLSIVVQAEDGAALRLLSRR